jgi:hypothetical protein
MIFGHKPYYNLYHTNPNKKINFNHICLKPKKLYKLYKLYNAKQKKLKEHKKKYKKRNLNDAPPSSLIDLTMSPR